VHLAMTKSIGLLRIEALEHVGGERKLGIIFKKREQIFILRLFSALFEIHRTVNTQQHQSSKVRVYN